MTVTQNPPQQRPDVCCALPSSPSISPSSLLIFFSLHFFGFYSTTSFSNSLVFYPSVTRVRIYCSIFIFYFFFAPQSHFNIIQQLNSGATGKFTLHSLLCCSDGFLLFFRPHKRRGVVEFFSRLRSDAVKAKINE